jgi:hypothetical protein
MALTKDDLKQIKGVVNEAIAEHPRFDALELKIEQSAKSVIDDLSDVMQEGFTMVGDRFDIVETRLDHVEKRLDNLRIASNS